jgi:hypothetical protein
MSIDYFLNRICQQTVVYWSNPVNDGEGGFSFDDPVEISCRLEEIKQINKMTEDVLEKQYPSILYTTEELDLNGMIFIGTLNDLDSTQEADPMLIEDGCYFIDRVQKIPVLGSTSSFLYKIYLAGR